MITHKVVDDGAIRPGEGGYGTVVRESSLAAEGCADQDVGDAVLV